MHTEIFSYGSACPAFVIFFMFQDFTCEQSAMELTKMILYSGACKSVRMSGKSVVWSKFSN